MRAQQPLSHGHDHLKRQLEHQSSMRHQNEELTRFGMSNKPQYLTRHSVDPRQVIPNSQPPKRRRLDGDGPQQDCPCGEEHVMQSPLSVLSPQFPPIPVVLLEARRLLANSRRLDAHSERLQLEVQRLSKQNESFRVENTSLREKNEQLVSMITKEHLSRLAVTRNCVISNAILEAAVDEREAEMRVGLSNLQGTESGVQKRAMQLLDFSNNTTSLVSRLVVGALQDHQEMLSDEEHACMENEFNNAEPQAEVAAIMAEKLDFTQAERTLSSSIRGDAQANADIDGHGRLLLDTGKGRQSSQHCQC